MKPIVGQPPGPVACIAWSGWVLGTPHLRVALPNLKGYENHVVFDWERSSDACISGCPLLTPIKKKRGFESFFSKRFGMDDVRKTKAEANCRRMKRSGHSLPLARGVTASASTIFGAFLRKRKIKKKPHLFKTKGRKRYSFPFFVCGGA